MYIWTKYKKVGITFSLFYPGKRSCRRWIHMWKTSVPICSCTTYHTFVTQCCINDQGCLLCWLLNQLLRHGISGGSNWGPGEGAVGPRRRQGGHHHLLMMEMISKQRQHHEMIYSFTLVDVGMSTFDCKRNLFYSWRILGHDRKHIQYATIYANVVSNSRGHSMSFIQHCNFFGLWFAAGQMSHRCAASVGWIARYLFRYCALF